MYPTKGDTDTSQNEDNMKNADNYSNTGSNSGGTERNSGSANSSESLNNSDDANGVGDENSSDSSTAPKTAQGVSCGDDTAYVYTVKTGDTLMSICKKHYGTTTKYTEVLKYNELDDANVLYVGQEIKLP